MGNVRFEWQLSATVNFSTEYLLTFTRLHLYYSRQIEELTDQRIQQSISSGQKVEEVRQEGEKKISQMKQELKEEQTKSKQREDEIAELRRYIYYIYSHTFCGFIYG